jgi:lipopolysaccharide export system protein LptA
MMTHSLRPSRWLAALLVVLASGLALNAVAEKADRDKPVNLEADRVTVDDAKKVHVFEGNVVLTQGTLVIRTDKLVVTQDGNGYQRGVATGGAEGLARFKQKREGRSDYVEGEAERIEHDARSEKSDFYVRAHVKSGQDEVRGPFISFDSRAETYVVNGGKGAAAGTTAAPATPGERVRAVIQPRKEAAEPGH